MSLPLPSLPDFCYIEFSRMHSDIFSVAVPFQHELQILEYLSVHEIYQNSMFVRFSYTEEACSTLVYT